MSELNANPLSQYFRRPALYLKLPSGGAGYPAHAIDLPENGEVPVYPMTAIDEITSRTPDALFNGTAVTELIKSCVPNIKDPWFCPVTDIDPLLVAIRTATSGNLMEIDTTCPSCNEDAKYDVNLSGILASYKPGDYSAPLMIEDLGIKFKPLPFKEINQVNLAQLEVQKMVMQLNQIEDQNAKTKKSGELLKSINEVAINLIANTIEYIKTPHATVLAKEYIVEFLQNCDKNVFDKIKNANLELRATTETKPLDVKCIHCGTEYKQQFIVNVTDFFE
jgi:hypothetical protein